MKYLYYKKLNDDVSCLPFYENLDESIKRAPISASNFTILEDPKHEVIFDGSKIREKNKDELGKKGKEKERREKKAIRLKREQDSTVEVSGKVFQVRKSDEVNLRIRIAEMEAGETTRWILANNNVALNVTKEDLQEVLRKGIEEGHLRFDAYMDELIALGFIED